MQGSIDALSVELEAALLRELAREHAWINDARFAGTLKAPLFALGDAAGRHGRWLSSARTIELARALVLERLWPEVVGVLEHEMAHQFVDEVLGVRDETAHGESFRRVCAERGIDARAAGAPVASTTEAGASAEVERVLDRIRKLLALAGSSNQHEAEIAMRRAHELMLRHNIEVARAHAERAFEVRHLGDPHRRRTRVESDIVSLLAASFFVKVIRLPVYLPRTGGRGSVFEISGTHANLAMAEHVYAFLLATAERLWHANRNDARVRSGRDRLSYQAGVVRGFREKLDAERVELRATGLIWRGDGKLDAFYHARHPRIAHRRPRVRVDGAHAAGCEAGRTVVLHRPIEGGARSGGATRLLR